MAAGISNRRRKEIARLSRRRHREERGKYLVEGVRSVEAAVAAGALLVDVVVTDAAISEPRVQALLEQVSVPVYVASEAELTSLSDVETPQGILAVAQVQWSDEEAARKAERVLVLDGLQNPGNVGTILRTAAWFGIETVAAGPGTVDLYHPKVVRAAMGGIWDVTSMKCDDLPSFISKMKEEKRVCYAADLEGTPANSWRPEFPSLLVLGSEAHGLSPDVREQVDERVLITGSDARKGTESLNVAVSASILLYAWDQECN